jgi:hypothetical protein
MLREELAILRNVLAEKLERIETKFDIAIQKLTDSQWSMKLKLATLSGTAGAGIMWGIEKLLGGK